MQNRQSPLAGDLLMPLPKHIKEEAGTFRLHHGTSMSVDPHFAQAVESIRTTLGCTIGGEDILVKHVEALPEEGYTMKISPRQIVIAATTGTGAFHGLETLRQMTLAAGNLIPCCKIEDEPRYAWRGLMLDSSRHYHSPAFIKKILDAMALHHLNRFHWHFCDDQGWRIPIDGYPLLQAIASKRKEPRYTDDRNYGGFYDEGTIEDIVAFAAERHIVVVPELEMPGHVSALLAAYPNLGCTGGPYEVQAQWGIFDEVLCPGNDETLAFLEASVKTIARLFPGPYIHIGGDECPHTAWKQCPKCRHRMETEGLKNEGELQGWLTEKVAGMVERVGKRPIGWDEVLEHTDRMGLPDSMIIMNWRGYAGGAKAARRGHDVIMSPNTGGCYLDYRHRDNEEEPGNIGVSTIAQAARFSPLDGIEENQAAVIGGQANLWTERVPFSRNAEYLLFPRLSFLAEQLWQPHEAASPEKRRFFLERKLSALDLACYRGPYES